MKKLILGILLVFAIAGCVQNSANTTTEAVPNQVTATNPQTSIQNASSYTLEEVAQHSTPDDCWLAIHGKVYNVSGLGAKHGGGDTIYEGCGKNATTLFETRPMGSGTPHSEKARTIAENFYIGDLRQ